MTRYSVAIWTGANTLKMFAPTRPEEIKPLVEEWLQHGSQRIVVGFEGKAYLIVPLNHEGTKYSRTEIAPRHGWNYYTFLARTE